MFNASHYHSDLHDKTSTSTALPSALSLILHGAFQSLLKHRSSSRVTPLGDSIHHTPSRVDKHLDYSLTDCESRYVSVKPHLLSQVRGTSKTTLRSIFADSESRSDVSSWLTVVTASLPRISDVPRSVQSSTISHHSQSDRSVGSVVLDCVRLN